MLGRFEAVPALESFEAANRMLGRAVNDFDTAAKKIRAVCVGPEGVAFVLAAPDHDAPEGFDPSADGTRWVVPHGRLDAVEAFYPAVPVALPVGTDDDGTWLVALQPGEVLPVLGESADALCRAARAGQEAWSWCDLVVVTDDPADPAFERAEQAVFFGDPSDLDPRTARHDGRRHHHPGRPERPHRAGRPPRRLDPSHREGRPPPAPRC